MIKQYAIDREEMEKILRELEVEGVGGVDQLLKAHRLFGYQLPEVATSLPFGVGRMAGVTGNLMGGAGRTMTPSPTGNIGELLQQLLRVSAPAAYTSRELQNEYQ